MNFVHAMNLLAGSWTWQVAHAAWQAALVGCMAVLFVRLAPRVPAQMRYAILLVALAKFAFPPLLSLPTGVFGLVTISESQIASSNVVSDFKSNAINVIATEATESSSGSNGQDAGRVEQTQPEAGTLIATGELDDSSQTPSARDMLAGAIQTPLTETTNGPNRTERSPVERKRPASAFNNSKSVLDAVFAVSAPSWLALVHAFGILLCAVLLAIRTRSLHRRKQFMVLPNAQIEDMYRETAQELGVRRLPKLLISLEKTGPYSFGVLRPTIVLPAICTGQLTTQAVRIVMAHELVHHRRGDLIVNAVQLAIAMVWWFHPVVWILNKSIRRIREDCCDDTLLAAQITHPSDYCQTLLNVANLCDCRRPQSGIAMSMATDKIPLASRFRRIMEERIDRGYKFAPLTVIGLVLFALVVLPGLTQRPTASAESPPEVPPVSTAHFTFPDEQARAPWPSETEFHVLDEAGEPVANAPLEIRLHYRNESVEMFSSDDQGIVRVQWPKERPQFVYATVKSPEYVIQKKGWHQRPVTCKVPPPVYEFKLVKGLPIGGMVLDDRANAIAGVTVKASIADQQGSEDYVATTDASGRWKIQNAPSEIVRVSLQLAHANFRSDPNQWSRLIGDRDIEAMRSEGFVATMLKGEGIDRYGFRRVRCAHPQRAVPAFFSVSWRPRYDAAER